MAEQNHNYTTVTVRRETHRRLADLKPYESMSFDELIEDMADSYHGDR